MQSDISTTDQDWQEYWLMQCTICRVLSALSAKARGHSRNLWISNQWTLWFHQRQEFPDHLSADVKRLYPVEFSLYRVHEKCFAKSTECESTPQYKEIFFYKLRPFEAWFTIHVHLIIKEVSWRVHLHLQRKRLHVWTVTGWQRGKFQVSYKSYQSHVMDVCSKSCRL
jgi:hypothetical protein